MADRTLAQIATTSTAASLLAGDKFYMVRSGVDFSLPGSVIISAIASAVSTSAATKEASLGNPAVTGYILSSTTSGVRSWIALPGSDWGSITGIPSAVSTFGAAGILSGALGGTGVANTGKTLTIGGNWTHTGAHTVSLTTTANTALTLPTTGTLATLVGVETLSNKAIESSEIGGVDPAPGSFTELYADIADLRAIAVNGGTINTNGAQFLLPSITDTTSRPFLITQTWDNAALDAIGVLVNITSADSGAGSLLQAWQLDGGTVASVDTSGRFLGSGSGLTALNASSITSGTVPTARLGTGTANSTTYLRGDQTWQTVSGGGGDALVANPLSQFAATTSLQLAGVISDETGSGALVFATSPTLVTPALGTPASGALTNCTSIPAAQLTGDIAAARITTALTTAQPVAATTLSATGTVTIATAPLINAGVNRFVHTTTNAHALAAELSANGEADAYNTFLGVDAGSVVSTGSAGQALGGRNVAIGYRAGKSNTTGWQNTGVGYLSLELTTTGIYNTALGAYTLVENTTGSNNTAIGADALWLNTTGASNTAIGTYALQNNSTAESNTAVGKDALRQTTTGGGNTAVGTSALSANAGGTDNAAFGKEALFASVGAQNNVAMGTAALRTLVTGNANVGVGSYSLYTCNGGINNVGIGFSAGEGITNGLNNTLIGHQSGVAATSADNSVLIGYRAGANITTGDNNIIIGASINAASATANDQLDLGGVVKGTVGTQVVGARGAAIADATDEASAIVAINLLLAHFRTWGSIAT